MLSTDDIMQGALAMAGMDEMPGDCGIYLPSASVNKVLFGIDIGPAELMLARELDCDLALAHHPNAATMGYEHVLSRHVTFMVDAGVPEDEAKEAVSGLIERIHFRFHSGNWDHAVSVARLLDMPFMNIHSPLDEIARKILVRQVESLPPDATVADVVRSFEELPEFSSAPTAVEVVHGDPDAPAGRVVVVMGAGTNGGFSVARAYFEHGVSTVVYIHLDHGELAKLREYGKGNLIMAGHIAGDILGMNPFADWLEQQGLEVVRFSGL